MQTQKCCISHWNSQQSIDGQLETLLLCNDHALHVCDLCPTDGLDAVGPVHKALHCCVGDDVQIMGIRCHGCFAQLGMTTTLQEDRMVCKEGVHPEPLSQSSLHVCLSL